MRAALLGILLWMIPAQGEGLIEMAPRTPPRRHDQCQLCHMRKSLSFMPAKHETQIEHKGYSLKHSRIEMSCNSCHDANRSNLLKTSERYPATWSHSSPVCQSCHAVVFRDWSQGIHGKRVGKWNGNRVQNHCIDCHNPHSVKYIPTPARPAPVRPAMGVEKHS